jgi:hypothetical protein
VTRLRTQAHAWTLALVGAVACLTPASSALAAPLPTAQTDGLAQMVEAEEQNVSGRAVWTPDTSTSVPGSLTAAGRSRRAMTPPCRRCGVPCPTR